jgi:hypothetical protein
LGRKKHGAHSRLEIIPTKERQKRKYKNA